MKNLKILLLFLFVSALTQTAFSQRRMVGGVVEVVDGKTVIIETATGGRVKIILQFIEIPEAEQPLHQTVKEHLEKTVLGKKVEFLPRRLTRETTIGQVFLEGVDLSQQLLRDGAAWYSLPEKDSQNEDERELYQLNEGQAKLEKRGVWSVENLKPAWEFRAEKEEIRKQQERTKLEELAAQNTSTSQTDKTVKRQTQIQVGAGFGLDMWSKVNNSVASNNSLANGGLNTGSIPNYGINYIETSGVFFNLKNGANQQKIETRTAYIYPIEQNGGQSLYAVGFFAESEKYLFAESNNLTIIADDRKISLGKAYRMHRQMPYSVQELLIYRIDSGALEKISKAQTLQINLGKFSGNIGGDFQILIKNLLAVTK